VTNTKEVFEKFIHAHAGKIIKKEVEDIEGEEESEGGRKKPTGFPDDTQLP